MELIFKIMGIGLITCIAALIVKPVRSDFAMIISMVGGIVILIMVLSSISGVLTLVGSLANKTGLNGHLIAVVIKIIGVGYLTEITASLCADTGNGRLGDKILLGGKIIILVMSLPIVTSILNIVMELLPT